ncbi:hypothetical protein SK3146_03492 [Paenibacillus konkukensis]|uniref:Peptidase n=1 Tax=Paenibacillus konkukensis TaxID=2020716 RepID=A0ABY4RRC1_9BACL|nr:DUF1796 family putative cysteine peptidase [Paenibacillus konkukensis]UQZ84259.1 hypothetical protein SK3146_03492 [Paenibacillus konkukensis]
MKWGEAKGKYKAFISLGSTCQTAHQLQRLGLRQFAGPLDWFISPSVPDLAKLLQSRFKSFMEWSNLQLISVIDNHYVVKDTVYQTESYHDLPLTAPWGAPYPQFKEKLSRRVNRFLKIINYGPICFVRIQTSEAEARHLEAALRSVTNKPFRLLIVNHHNQPTNDVIHEDWGLKHVCSVKVPAGMDWRGSDRAWDTIMTGFSL